MPIRPVLLPYLPIARMLVQTFGPDCEVVLHDLTDPAHSVVYVENGTVTGRKIGDSFDHLIREVLLSEKLQDGFAANYYFTAPNGRRIRSSSLLIQDEAGKLAGALCINLDTTRVTQQLEFLQSLLPGAASEASARETQPGAHVSVMIEDLMDSILAGADAGALTRDERIEKIRFMDEKGLFLVKGSVEKAAEKLGVNKVTIYSYLDEARGKRA